MSEVVAFPGAARAVDGCGRSGELRREPGESLYDYLQRIAYLREAEIERLNRLVAAQDSVLAEARALVIRRIHQIYLETGAAMLALGLLFGVPELDVTDRLAALILFPLVLIGTGIGFLSQAPAIDRLAARFARRRGA